MDFCDQNFTRAIVSELISKHRLAYGHRVFYPILLIAGFVSIALNVFLVLVRNTRRMRVSPMLVLSLNLAATDGLCSFFVVLNLLNVYLHYIFGVIILTPCHGLLIEVIRHSSLFASILHLLALTWLHYEATTNPLEHRLHSIFQERRAIHGLSIFCWSISLAFFTLIFLSYPCQGFRVEDCREGHIFMLFWRYRLTILLCFSTPLLIMLLAYCRIFHALYFGTDIFRSKKNQTDDKQSEISNSAPNGTSSTFGNFNNRRHCKRTVVTSLIIVGTYLTCWIPNISFLALSCQDGCPFPLLNQPFRVRSAAGFITYGLIILKAIVDPFIYSYRMKEVKCAIKFVFCGRTPTDQSLGRRSTYCVSQNDAGHTTSFTLSGGQREHYL